MLPGRRAGSVPSMERGLVGVVVIGGWLCVASPALAQLSDPVELATPVPTSSVGSQYPGRVLFDGDRLYAHYADFSGPRVAEVDLASAMLTELGGSQGEPGACVGDVCLVERSREIPGSADRDFEIYRVRIDGSALDATPILARRTDPAVQFAWRYAGAGDHFLLLTYEYDLATATYSHTLRSIETTGASPVGPERPFASPGGFPDFACTATRCGFVAFDGTTYRLVQTDLDGAPVPIPGVAFGSTSAGVIRVRATTTAFRVASDYLYEIETDGTVRTPTWLGFEGVRDLDCLPSGECVVAGRTAMWSWAGGTVSGLHGSFGYVPHAVGCGRAWCAGSSVNGSPGTVEIAAFQLDSGSFTRATTFEVGAVDSPQTGLVGIAANVVLFHRWVGGRYQLLSVRLSDGAPTGPPMPVLGDLTFPASILAATPAGDHVAFIVSSAATGTALLRLDLSGAPLDTPSVLDAADRPSGVAWNGLHHLVAWIDPAGRLLMRRYDEIGQRVEETPIVVRTGATGVAVLDDPDTMGWVLLADTGAGIRAYFVGPDGVASRDVVVRDGNTARLTASRIAAGTLVAWFEPSPSGPGGQIRTAVLSSAGEASPLGGRILSSVSAERFVLGGTSGRVLLGMRTGELWVQMLDAAGATSGAELLVHRYERGVGAPIPFFAAGVIGRGPTTIVYDAVVPIDETTSRSSVWARTLADPALPGDPCATGSDCGSGACVGGICCDRACAGGCETCESGTCAIREAGAECRAAVEMCDVAEVCDGSSAECPAPATTSCDAGLPDAGLDVGTIPTDTSAPTIDAGASGSGGGGCHVGRRRGGLMWLVVLAVCLARRLA